MITVPLFSIPFSFEKNVFNVSKEELDYIKSLNFKSLDKNKVNVSEDSYILNNPKLHRIKKIILEKTIDYKNKVLEIGNEIDLTTSWATVNNKNSQHPQHSHYNTFISSVLYLQAKNVTFVLTRQKNIFQDAFYFNYKINNINLHNCSSFSLKVESGDIIFFPAWFHHYSTENLDEEDKVLIGANFFLKGEVGSYEGTDLIHI